MGLHESQGVLGRVLGDPPGEDAEPPVRRLQPRLQLLRRGRALRLKGGEDGAYLAGELPQGRKRLSQLSLRTCQQGLTSTPRELIKKENRVVSETYLRALGTSGGVCPP